MKRLNILITNWRAVGGLGWVSLAARALDCAVWIKAYDGGHWLDLGQPFAVIAAELQRQGVDVGAWGFHYGHWTEVDRLVECYTYRHGIKGYEGPRAGLLIDAESEFERPDGRDWADAQVAQVRAAQLDVPVYYTSFAFPLLHPSFPYDVFNRLSGGHVPQVYYNHQGWPRPATAIIQTVNQHAARGLNLTGAMLPIYDAGPEQGWRPSPADFHEATLAMAICAFRTAWTWSWEYHEWPDWVALWHYARLVAGLNAQ